MSTLATAPTAPAGPHPGMQGFLRTTGRIGPATMAIGLALSLAGPAYLYFLTDLGVSPEQILKAYLGVAAVFGILWIVEPLAYFPVLGSSAMYQAFMIGNISSKLLPAAVVAQDAIKAKPGTPRGDLAAVLAICGAAVVHLTSLFVFVGLLGTWLLSVLPADVTAVVRVYILPAVLGAVFVQAIMSYKAPRTTVVALVIGAAVTFLLLPAAPALKFYGVAITVALTMVVAWLLRPRTAAPAPDDDDAQPELHY